jgi:hypothetical protein
LNFACNQLNACNQLKTDHLAAGSTGPAESAGAGGEYAESHWVLFTRLHDTCARADEARGLHLTARKAQPETCQLPATLAIQNNKKQNCSRYQGIAGGATE